MWTQGVPSPRIRGLPLYETRRMLYSLYNAMGEDEWIMQSGSPRMRGDGMRDVLAAILRDIDRTIRIGAECVRVCLGCCGGLHLLRVGLIRFNE